MGDRERKLPPLHLLTGFEASARHLSFTKAAAELALSQSAVSKQVKALEEHMGCVLFERLTRSLVLTPEGHRLYGTTREMLDQLDQAANRLRPASIARQVSLATSSGFASLWLIPRLASFRALHPDIDVRISASPAIVNLEQHRLDLSIRFCTPAAAPLGAVRLFTHSTLPVCAPALLDKARLRQPSDLKDHVLLHASFSTEHKAYVGWDTWLTALGLGDLRPGGSLYFNHYELAIQAALQGQGVALGIDTLVADLIRDAHLVAPFPRSLAESRNCYLVSSVAASRRSEVEAFIGWLRQEASTDETMRVDDSASASPT